jgi:hypothetical protein
VEQLPSSPQKNKVKKEHEPHAAINGPSIFPIFAMNIIRQSMYFDQRGFWHFNHAESSYSTIYLLPSQLQSFSNRWIAS